MIYEFGYKGTEFRRNIYVTADQLSVWVKKAESKDMFRSVFGYGSKDIPNCDIYSGFYCDLDNKYDLNLVYQDLLFLLGLFKDLGIRNDDFRLFFSGSKGFHINFSYKAMGIPPSSDLDQVYKLIAKELNSYIPNPSLDLTVYERRRLWRIINSLNSKSGLYKIQLNLPLLPLTEILELAKTPQPTFKTDPKPNPILTGWVTRARRELYKPKKIYRGNFSNQDKRIHPKIQELLQGVGQNRNQTAYYLACYLNSKGFREAEIKSMLSDFGEKCTPPTSANYSDFNTTAIERTVQSALKGGRYGDSQ